MALYHRDVRRKLERPSNSDAVEQVCVSVVSPVSIDVDRRLDRLVAQAKLNLVQVPALIDEPSRVGMPEVVNTGLLV